MNEAYLTLAVLYNEENRVKQLGGTAAMNYEKAYAIRYMKAKHPDTTTAELAWIFNVSQETISNILKHRTWKGDRTLTRVMFAYLAQGNNLMEILENGTSS